MVRVSTRQSGVGCIIFLSPVFRKVFPKQGPQFGPPFGTANRKPVSQVSRKRSHFSGGFRPQISSSLTSLSFVETSCQESRFALLSTVQKQGHFPALVSGPECGLANCRPSLFSVRFFSRKTVLVLVPPPGQASAEYLLSGDGFANRDRQTGSFFAVELSACKVDDAGQWGGRSGQIFYFSQVVGKMLFGMFWSVLSNSEHTSPAKLIAVHVY